MAIQPQEECGLGEGGGKTPGAGRSCQQSGGSGVDEAEGRRPFGDVPGNSEANAALQQVLGKEKVPKALQDREPEAEASAPASSKKKDEDVVEADVLSDIGDRKDTKEATSRVSKMLKLVKSVQKQVGSEKAKALNSSLEALKKLEKVKKTQLGKGQDHTV